MSALVTRWWMCLPLAAVLSCGAAAGGGGGGGGGACDRDLSGTWSISGSCLNSRCTVQQNGCTVSVACGDGSRFTGSVVGSSFSGSVNAGTRTLSCQGTIAPGSFVGSCIPPTSGSSCSFSATCSGGACGAAMGGGDDAGVGDAGVGDECPTATNCMACTMRSTCGWCDGRCSVGTSTGPRGTVCADRRWAWTLGMCGGGDGSL